MFACFYQKLALEKMHIYKYCHTGGIFCRNDAQNLYHSADIHNNRDTGISFYQEIYQYDSFVVACLHFEIE